MTKNPDILTVMPPVFVVDLDLPIIPLNLTAFFLVIRDLGGMVIESNFYDARCTHLVVGKPSRAEKYLAACASGKW